MARDTVLGNISSFIGNALGGVRGRQNVAAWIVAGTAAYFLWIKPERDALREAEAMAIQRREKDLHRYVERTRPISDPQDRGLIRGKGSRLDSGERQETCSRCVGVLVLYPFTFLSFLIGRLS